MNEDDESLPDELIGDLLAPLREVSVPEEVRAANRAAVARALARHTRAPWWRRTVAVPVPIAIAATLAIVATTVALVLPTLGRQSAEHNVPQLQANQVAVTDSNPNFDPGNPAAAAWSVSRSYIRSIESLATVRVTAEFDTKEKRDDS